MLPKNVLLLLAHCLHAVPYGMLYMCPYPCTLQIFETVGPQLICLDMTGCHQIMTDDILRLIVKNCKALEDLCLAFCMKLTGEPLRMLFRDQERSSNLTLLRMSGCKDVSNVLYTFLKGSGNFVSDSETKSWI